MKEMNKFTKQFIIVTLVLVLFVSVVFGVIKYKEHKEYEKERKEFAIELKQKKKETEYKLNLTQTIETINNTYTETKPMVSLMGGLWHDNIFGNVYGFNLTIKYGLKKDVTDKLLQPLANGEAIPSIKQGRLSVVHVFVLGYETETGTLAKIDGLNTSAKTQVDKLKNPPKKYKDVYNEILTYYTDVNSYVGLAKQPQGNYEQYTSKMTDLSTKLQGQYTQLKMKIQ